MDVIIILAVFLILAFGAFYRGNASRMSRVNAMFAYVRRMFPGRLRKGGEFRSPRLTLHYGHAEVAISWHRSEFIEVRVECPAQHRFHIFSGYVPDRFRYVFEDCAHEPWRRAGFTISSSNEDVLQRVFEPEVIVCLSRLRSLSDSQTLDVRRKSQQLIIRLFGRVDTGAKLERIVERSLDLFELIELTQAVGIAWLQSQIAERPICKICGEAIETNLVQCRRCRTPHHQDCWQYNGACSTYACRESEFTVPVDGHADQVRLP